MTERSRTQKSIGIGIAAIALACIVGYALYELENVWFGPEISIATPADGATVRAAVIAVTGRAKNIASITLDGRPIFIDTAGNFSDEVVLSPGYNAISLEAADRFGSKTERTLEVTYRPVL